MVIEIDSPEINRTVKNSTAKPRNSSLQNIKILSLYIKGRVTLYHYVDHTSIKTRKTSFQNKLFFR